MSDIDDMMKRLSERMDKNPNGIDAQIVKKAGLTEKEVDTVIAALHRGNPDFTDEEAHFVVKWVTGAAVFGAMAGLITKGVVDVVVKDGDVAIVLRKEKPE